MLLAVLIAGVLGADADPRRAFDEQAAFAFLRQQVAFGPRPAGSAASRRVAAMVREHLPGGRYQPVPGGLRNVVGVVRGRTPARVVIVGAHYDTKDMPRCGANDGASGTAVVLQLARGRSGRGSCGRRQSSSSSTGRSRRLGPTTSCETLPARQQGGRARLSEGRLDDPCSTWSATGNSRSRASRDEGTPLGATAGRSASKGKPLRSPSARRRRFSTSTHRSNESASRRSTSSTAIPCWHRMCDDLSAVSARSPRLRRRDRARAPRANAAPHSSALRPAQELHRATTYV